MKERKKSVLEGVPASLPAVVKAYRIQDKAKAQVQAAMDMRVIIHRRPGLTREMRLVWHSTEGDVPLDIISIAPVGKHGLHLEIMASSGIRNAQ